MNFHATLRVCVVTTPEEVDMSDDNRHVRQPLATLIGLQAATLAIMSILHLTGIVAGGTRPFRPTDAGIAEAVICLVLFGGAAALVRHPPGGRVVALAALGFAILGVIAGLGFTVGGGDAVDVAYHATLLPLLLITLAAVSKRLPLHPHPPTAPGGA
jgi:hypothetical protein